MEQIRDIFRSNFSKFWLNFCSEIWKSPKFIPFGTSLARFVPKCDMTVTSCACHPQGTCKLTISMRSLWTWIEFHVLLHVYRLSDNLCPPKSRCCRHQYRLHLEFPHLSHLYLSPVFLHLGLNTYLCLCCHLFLCHPNPRVIYSVTYVRSRSKIEKRNKCRLVVFWDFFLIE